MEKGNKDNSSDEFNLVFKNVSDKLKEADDIQALSHEFAKLKSDEERVAFALNLECIQEITKVEPRFQKKSAEKSAELRSKGNSAFQKQQNEKALDFYTESVLCAPISSDCDFQSRELTLAYANRSAVLYQMKEHELCLEDIQRAFQCGYPDDLHYKLYYRRGGCLRSLGEGAAAIESFQQAKKCVDNSKLDKKKGKAFKSDIETQIKLCTKGNVNEAKRKVKHSEKMPPSLSYGPNSRIPCLSSAVEIVSSLEQGRYAVATRDIKVGDVLLVEKPFASVVLRACNTCHCQHCYKSVLAPIPCLQCAGVAYCSTECRDESWSSYHQTECKYLDLIQNIGLGMGHLALRIVIQTGLPFLLEFRDQLKSGLKMSENGILPCNDDGIYTSEYATIYKLVTHARDRTIGDLFKRAVKSIYLLKCLEHADYFKTADTADLGFDVKAYIGGLILTHSQSIPCNAHEVSEYELYRSSIEKCQFLEVGSGLYATMSLLNHSCDPAVTRNCYGDTCVVRATRNIYKGDEIVDNYGYLYPVHEKAERQTKLREQYFFSCKCEACIKNWPLYPQIEEVYPKYRCVECHGALKIPPMPNMKAVKCASCHNELDVLKNMATIRTSEVVYKSALNKVLNGEIEGMTPALRSHLILMDEMICRPWKDINNCQEALKQCYNVDANCVFFD
ncbi:SET and MYND domain-containing protein 4-like [Ptychodera flava]|uniref:SET and MYND domain-containing protein 4-like n=1 Tax=Ptychodera flava TaxID=63121 RepID=UPI003969D707